MLKVLVQDHDHLMTGACYVSPIIDQEPPADDRADEGRHAGDEGDPRGGGEAFPGRRGGPARGAGSHAYQPGGQPAAGHGPGRQREGTERRARSYQEHAGGNHYRGTRWLLMTYLLCLGISVEIFSTLFVTQSLSGVMNYLIDKNGCH